MVFFVAHFVFSLYHRENGWENPLGRRPLKPHIHLISRGYLLGPIFPFKGSTIPRVFPPFYLWMLWNQHLNLHPGKLRWQWNTNHERRFASPISKIFHCNLTFRGGKWWLIGISTLNISPLKIFLFGHTDSVLRILGVDSLGISYEMVTIRYDRIPRPVFPEGPWKLTNL